MIRFEIAVPLRVVKNGVVDDIENVDFGSIGLGQGFDVIQGLFGLVGEIRSSVLADHVVGSVGIGIVVFLNPELGVGGTGANLVYQGTRGLQVTQFYFGFGSHQQHIGVADDGVVHQRISTSPGAGIRKAAFLRTVIDVFLG